MTIKKALFHNIKFWNLFCWLSVCILCIFNGISIFRSWTIVIDRLGYWYWSLMYKVLIICSKWTYFLWNLDDETKSKNNLCHSTCRHRRSRPLSNKSIWFSQGFPLTPLLVHWFPSNDGIVCSRPPKSMSYCWNIEIFY